MDKTRLREIPLFAGLEEDDLATIATFAQETSAGAGEVLVREGDFAYELMVIEEGTAEVERGGDVVAELGPGDFFGESVVTRQMRGATVRATSGMRLVMLSAFEVARLRKMPGVLEAINRTAAARA